MGGPQSAELITWLQLDEYRLGWTMLSWYNILHTVSTQVHTVHPAASRGRQRRHGSQAATHNTKTRLKRHTCTRSGARDKQVRWVTEKWQADR